MQQQSTYNSAHGHAPDHGRDAHLDMPDMNNGGAHVAMDMDVFDHDLTFDEALL